MAVALTHQQAVNREKDIQDELERLKSKDNKTAEDLARVAPLVAEFREVHQHRLDLEHDAALAEIRSATGAAPKDTESERAPEVSKVDEIRAGTPSLGGKYRNPWDTSEMRYRGGDNGDELRGRALDAIERMPHADSKVREVSARLVERDEGTGMAEQVLASSSPEYTKAFMKVLRNKGNLAGLNNGEQRALQRAMSLTDADGGFLVPFQLDPTVILTANGSFNQVRQISRVVQTAGDKWRGITSAGVTGSWDGEGVEVSDDSPTLARPEIPVHKGDVFVAASFEVQGDASGLASDLSTMIAEEKDRMESVSFVTGSGTGQPKGVITALVAAGGSTIVGAASDGAFAVSDVYTVDGELPARWAANGSWLSHRKTYNVMRQFDTNGGSVLWGQLSEARRSELLGRPDYVAEAMTPVAAADNTGDIYALLFGDFRNYVIVDRIGTTMSYIPHLFGANGRPTGESGWYAYFRTGADVVNPGAFRLLKV